MAKLLGGGSWRHVGLCVVVVILICFQFVCIFVVVSTNAEVKTLQHELYAVRSVESSRI